MNFFFQIVVYLALFSPLVCATPLYAKRGGDKIRKQRSNSRQIELKSPENGKLHYDSWQIELLTKIQQSNFPQWMKDQIQEDLAPFGEKSITLLDIEKTINDHHPLGFVLCKIQSNQIIWSAHPFEVNNDHRAKMLIEGLSALVRTVSLPDVTFLVFVGESFAESENKVPVFSWCKHEKWGRKTVCIPDYEALTGNFHFLKEVQVGIQRYPWESKENKAFWRGGTTSGWGFAFMPRLKLAQVAAQFPSLIDAKFSGLFPGQENDVELTPHMGKGLTVSEHLRYKYQILVDGHVSAFSRAYWQLFSNCVIFKHDSPWYQWFYRELRPYEHYIPYEADASDLVEKIQWAIEHDNEVRLITQNANDFANKNLKYSDVMLYTYLLLNEYAKLQDF